MSTKRLMDAGLALVGCVVLAFSALAAVRKYEFVQRAHRSPGSVVAVTHGPAHVQVAFNTPDGQRVEFPGNGWISHRKDDQVGVLFLDEDPRATAELDEPGAIWYLPASFAGLGLAVFGAGLFGVLRKR